MALYGDGLTLAGDDLSVYANSVYFGLSAP